MDHPVSDSIEPKTKGNEEYTQKTQEMTSKNPVKVQFLCLLDSDILVIIWVLICSVL